MNRVLITGITGLIGHHLMQRLAQDSEYRITGQYHSARDLSDYERMGITMRQADLCKQISLNDLCQGCDTVVHSAARVIDHGSRELFYQTHVEATRWLLEDAARHGVSHFIYISSFGPATYLNRKHGLPDETIPLRKSGIHYDDAKIEAEKLVRHFCRQHAMDFTIVRPAAVIGPDSVWVNEPLRRARSHAGLTLISHGRLDACLLSADNLADGLQRILEKPVARNQTYFFYDEYGVSWQQYFSDLLALEGLAPAGSLPRPIALLLAQLCESLFPLFGRKPPISVKGVIATSSERRVDVSKAREELGWQSAVSYAETMAKIATSLKRQA